MARQPLFDEELVEKPVNTPGNQDDDKTLFHPDWLLLLELPKPHIASDALTFCLRQGLLRYLLIAIDLIKQYFPAAQEFRLQWEQDPETGEEWLVLDITLQGEVDEILDSYDRYTSQWVSLVPWPERDKFRLSYNIT